jgi:molybdate transport system substrate-binding protein
MFKRLFAVFGLLVTLIAAPLTATAQDVPVVVAAADLQFALTEIADAFKKETKREVKLTFGSSGNFFRQIQQGAPFQMYLSADEKFAFDLADKGLTIDRGKLYAVGRIVIITPHGSPLKADGTLADLKAALADGRIKKFAIANPEHAPYGLRAEEALRHVGLWDALKDKLVLGENVSQAAQFATSGGAQGLLARAVGERIEARPVRTDPGQLSRAVAATNGAPQKRRRNRQGILCVYARAERPRDHAPLWFCAPRRIVLSSGPWIGKHSG